MAADGFETAMPASEWPQNHALERAVFIAINIHIFIPGTSSQAGCI